MSNSNHTLGGFLPLGVSRKRSKETETGPKPVFKKPSFISKPVPLKPTTKKEIKPPVLCDNRLLAGCMANEFLSKGTLFGQRYDQARAEAAPLSAKKKVGNDSAKLSNKKPESESELEPGKSYAEVATLLKRDGTHIPGIVNPTQLGRWLQM